MAPEPISTAYFINPSHQSVYVYPLIVARELLGKNPPIVATQRLGKNVAAAKNTHTAIEELLDASFSKRSVTYQAKYMISFSQNFLFIK
jgi:hypothetical protein